MKWAWADAVGRRHVRRSIRRALAVAVASFATFATAAPAVSAVTAAPWEAEPLRPQPPLGNERATVRNSLYSGEHLEFGESLHSPNGRYLLKLQRNGNLVLYDMEGFAQLPTDAAHAGGAIDVALANRHVPLALWDARTADSAAGALVMGADGDLALHAADAAVAEPLWHTRTANRPGAFLDVRDDGTIVVGYRNGRVLWTAGTSMPNVGLAGTKHVVYDRGNQRMWLIEDDGSLFDTYPVSGRASIPSPGAYSVFSKSLYSSSPRTPVTMRDMVRFVEGTTGLDIGFHSIPRTYGGEPIQTVDELGQPRSAGCVRQDDAKARQLYEWAPIGTPVIVVA